MVLESGISGITTAYLGGNPATFAPIHPSRHSVRVRSFVLNTARGHHTGSPPDRKDAPSKPSSRERAFMIKTARVTLPPRQSLLIGWVDSSERRFPWKSSFDKPISCAYHPCRARRARRAACVSVSGVCVSCSQVVRERCAGVSARVCALSFGLRQPRQVDDLRRKAGVET